jgi:hypothetical protein
MLKRKFHYRFVTFLIACVFLTGLSGAALAQSQDDSAPSVAEAARRAREQKKTAAKPVRTLTNDDLPAAPVSGANAAEAQVNPAKAGDNAAAATSDANQAQAAPVNDEKTKEKNAENAAALEHAKKELAQAEHELDVTQRKAALDSDAYYAKPDFANDKDGKANLDAEAQQISDKKQAVETLKARVAELQALVGEAPSLEPDKNPPNN